MLSGEGLKSEGRRIKMEEKLKEAFLGMKKQEAIALVENCLHSEADPIAILKTCQEAMEEVGKRFGTGEFFLTELIYSAEIFKAISSILELSLTASGTVKESRGIVVFGTPRGDIHDLGKNLVITMMRAQGFTVHDVGVNVPPERFIEKLQKTGSRILALSALITPTFASMKETISLLEETGLRKKTFVIIGGAITNDLVRKEVGADAQTVNPIEGIRLCSEYLLR
jgi:methanogenic corrinoid protein MtbC1